MSVRLCVNAELSPNKLIYGHLPAISYKAEVNLYVVKRTIDISILSNNSG